MGIAIRTLDASTICTMPLARRTRGQRGFRIKFSRRRWCRDDFGGNIERSEEDLLGDQQMSMT